MTRKIALGIIALLVLVALAGCGISQEEYDQLSSELAGERDDALDKLTAAEDDLAKVQLELAAKNTLLDNANAELLAKNKELEEINQELDKVNEELVEVNGNLLAIGAGFEGKEKELDNREEAINGREEELILAYAIAELLAETYVPFLEGDDTSISEDAVLKLDIIEFLRFVDTNKTDRLLDELIDSDFDTDEVRAVYIYLYETLVDLLD